MLKIFVRRFGKSFALLTLALVLLVRGCYSFVNWKTKTTHYDEIAQIPARHVGLVLGTSKRLRDGSPNPFFQYRIEAAAKLYKAQKIKYLLLSGDNRHHTYNEPQDMKKALVAQGVPEQAIFMDYAGLRTFDSVVRCQQVFGQQQFTIISQRFHNQRALYIAKQMHIDAIAFDAEDVGFWRGFKTHFREQFARVKVLIDMHLLHPEPHFLGEKLYIPS